LIDQDIERGCNLGVGVDEHGRLHPDPGKFDGSRAKIDGCTTKKRDRKVAAPRRVPAPKWLKTCRRPSSATTVCPACAPPLKRITAASGSRATMASTAKPLPSSPKLAPITAVALRGFMTSPPASCDGLLGRKRAAERLGRVKPR